MPHDPVDPLTEQRIKSTHCSTLRIAAPIAPRRAHVTGVGEGVPATVVVVFAPIVVVVTVTLPASVLVAVVDVVVVVATVAGMTVCPTVTPPRSSNTWQMKSFVASTAFQSAARVRSVTSGDDAFGFSTPTKRWSSSIAHASTGDRDDAYWLAYDLKRALVRASDSFMLSSWRSMGATFVTIACEALQ
jgi:hypothetical protein